MPRAVALSAALALIGTAALAADLPPNTKLGAMFAKPYVAALPVVVVREPPIDDYPIFVFAPQNDVRPFVNGYYGKPGSYYYRPYYGYADDTYTRLPYACGFFGYC
jgi:hypothetical protein